MKKRASFSTKGQRAIFGDFTIDRIFPNRYTHAVGPFVFLDHLIPKVQTSAKNGRIGAHPHRGIASLSYVIAGECEHFDSIGNYAKVSSGGIQWIKTGNGIMHDESLNVDSLTGNNYTHAFQFWINLPSKNKAEKPEHLAIQGNEVPRKSLPNDGGWIKVIVGKYEDLNAKIPIYTYQFLYHIQLEADKNFTISFNVNIEVAVFLPSNNALLNDVEFSAGEFIEFDKNAGDITIGNNGNEAVEILLFGGENYAEPIVAEGPFVMNKASEIAEAYRDFSAGKYGEINY